MADDLTSSQYIYLGYRTTEEIKKTFVKGKNMVRTFVGISVVEIRGLLQIGLLLHKVVTSLIFLAGEHPKGVQGNQPRTAKIIGLLAFFLFLTFLTA